MDLQGSYWAFPAATECLQLACWRPTVPRTALLSCGLRDQQTIADGEKTSSIDYRSSPPWFSRKTSTWPLSWDTDIWVPNTGSALDPSAFPGSATILSVHERQSVLLRTGFDRATWRTMRRSS